MLGTESVGMSSLTLVEFVHQSKVLFADMAAVSGFDNYHCLAIGGRQAGIVAVGVIIKPCTE